MISTDADTLVTLLDQEFTFFLGQRDHKRQLMLLPRLVDWLAREPRVFDLLQEVTFEAKSAETRFQDWRQKVHTDLGALWSTYSSSLTELLAPDSQTGHLNALGTLDSYEARCQRAAEHIPCGEYPSKDDSEAQHLIDTLLHWTKWATDTHERENRPAPPEGLWTAVHRLEELQEYEFRAFQSSCVSGAGAAANRLISCVRRSRIAPAAADLSDEQHAAWFAEHLEDLAFARALYTPGADLQHTHGLAGDAFEEIAASVSNDASLVYHELRQRVLLGWSRQSIVRRYAARCQAFDASRLRELADGETRRAEAALTRDFARYLFDQGLTPLLEPEIGRLRPDIIDVGASSTFYVEAKQYVDKSPRHMLVSAYQQVWSTWGRLRAQHRCPEAFLVVFRRSGPRVELPAQLRTGELVLHSVLVDISLEAGSSERQDPIRLDAVDLLPRLQESDGPKNG